MRKDPDYRPGINLYIFVLLCTILMLNKINKNEHPDIDIELGEQTTTMNNNNTSTNSALCSQSYQQVVQQQANEWNTDANDSPTNMTASNADLVLESSEQSIVAEMTKRYLE